MARFNEVSYSVTPEQQSLLQQRSFSLRPLSTAGRLDVWKAFVLTLHPIAVFVFTLLVLTWSLRLQSPQTVSAVCAIGNVLLFIFPVSALGVLLFGVAATGVHSRIRWSAALFWTWWPFFKVALCCLAVVAASTIANYVWYNNFLLHAQYKKMQSYEGVTPLTVGGIRLQDAGIATFSKTAGVDRARIGCLKNGATYCVAPILDGGSLPLDKNEKPQYDIFNGDVSHKQQYDLFMAGVDCCSCPGEFRCGNWNTASTLGGLRVLDGERQKFFQLAAEEWSATHDKLVVHPIFFEWVADPVAVYQEMQSKGNRLVVLSLLVVPSGLVLLAMLLNAILHLLCQMGLAAPLKTPLPPAGMGRALSVRFLPHLHKEEEEEEPQQPNVVML